MEPAPQQHSAARPRLKLHDPDNRRSLGELSLVAVFVELAPRIARDVSPETMQQYRRAVELFANFDASRPPGVSIWNPDHTPRDLSALNQKGGGAATSRDHAAGDQSCAGGTTVAGAHDPTANAAPDRAPHNAAGREAAPPAATSRRGMQPSRVDADPLASAGIVHAAGGGYTGMSYTCVADIDDARLAEFADWLAANHFAASTCRRHLARLGAIFRRLAPRSENNRGGLGIIADPPHCKPPRGRKPRTASLELETLDRLYRAAADMTWPARGEVAPAAAWRALLVLLYNLGPRPWSDGVLLPRQAVCLAPECPDEDCQHTNAAGWLCYTPTKTRRYDRELVLPLNDVCEQHFRPLILATADAQYSAAESGGRLSVAGDTKSRPLLLPFGRSNKTFYGQWSRLCERARVEKFDLRRIRKTANTQYNRLRAGLGKWFLGHAPQGTNETFYQDVMPLLLDGIHRLPQPEAFVTLIDKPIERQSWFEFGEG